MYRLSGKLIAGAAATAGVVGAVGAVGAATSLGVKHLLMRQADLARAVIGKPLGEIAPDADKTYKKSYGGKPIQLLMLGDSIAAGLGAEEPNGTPGARLAKKLGKTAKRPVRLTTGAVVGSETSRVMEQLERLPETYHADVAVLVVGGNDVIHRVPISESAKQLAEIIATLREQGVPVVVGTCPDIGALRAVPQPLRALGSRVSRQLGAAQSQAALEAGAYVVNLSKVVRPFFITNPDEMFSLDRFHPSTLGYRRTAEAMLPSVLAALGINDDVPFGHKAPPLS